MFRSSEFRRAVRGKLIRVCIIGSGQTELQAFELQLRYRYSVPDDSGLSSHRLSGSVEPYPEVKQWCIFCPSLANYSCCTYWYFRQTVSQSNPSLPLVEISRFDNTRCETLKLILIDKILHLFVRLQSSCTVLVSSALVLKFRTKFYHKSLAKFCLVAVINKTTRHSGESFCWEQILIENLDQLACLPCFICLSCSSFCCFPFISLYSAAPVVGSG